MVGLRRAAFGAAAGSVRWGRAPKGAPLLFVGHAADRTGPPIYLLHFLRWLRINQPGIDFEIALLAGGELEQDFRDLAPTSVYRGLPPTRWDDLERRLLMRRLEAADWWWGTRREHQLRRQMRQHAASRVVFVNSAPSVELARLLPPARRTLISHVHELEVGLTHLMGGADRRLLLEGADQIHSCSEAVRTNLITRHHVEPSVIINHYEMVDARELPTKGLDDRREARRTRGLPTNGLIAGSCGTVDWRKAVDLFIRLAWHVAQRPWSEPVTFVWVGGNPDAVARAEEAARAAGVSDVVRFVGIQSDPVEWFRLMDVFVLPAREDPFPLVCLEAASVGCPIVAFDNGGMPELLVQGCGLVATYPDVHDLAAKVSRLLEDADLRRSMGQRGRDLVRANHDVSVLAPRLWADIERWMP